MVIGSTQFHLSMIEDEIHNIQKSPRLHSNTLICKYCDNSFYDEILNTYLCDLNNNPVDLDTPCTKGAERE